MGQGRLYGWVALLARPAVLISAAKEYGDPSTGFHTETLLNKFAVAPVFRFANTGCAVSSGTRARGCLNAKTDLCCCI